MASNADLKRKLWLVICIQLAIIVLASAAYIFISHRANSPEAIYGRAMKTIGMGMEEILKAEILEQTGASRLGGHLELKGFDHDQGQQTLEELGLWDPSDEAANVCFNQMLDANNQVRFEFNADFGSLEPGQILGDARVEADLSLNQSPVGGFEVRLIDESGPDQQLAWPPLYLLVDKTDCLVSLAGELPPDFLGNWWFIDLSLILGDELDSDPFSLLGLLDVAGGNLGGDDEVNLDDIDQLLGIIVNSLKTYVFTGEMDDMIFQMTGDVDKNATFEGQDGLYKYDVEFNSQNAARLTADFVYEFWTSQFAEKTLGGLFAFGGTELPRPTPFQIQQLAQQIDDSGWAENYKFEVWVNPKTKLLHNFRITEINPLSGSLGSTLDLGLRVDGQKIEAEIKVRYFSADDQCRSAENGVGLSRAEYDQQSDCPYLLDPELEAVPTKEGGEDCPDDDALFDADDETIDRCFSFRWAPDPPYTRLLKGSVQPHQIHTLEFIFGVEDLSLDINYSFEQEHIEVVVGLDSGPWAEEDNQITTPENARPLEEILGDWLDGLTVGGLGLPNPVSQQDNQRLIEVSVVSEAINRYVASNGALPANRSDIGPWLDSPHDSPLVINAAGAWAEGSADGEFISLADIGPLNDVQAQGGVKLASDDADAINHLMVFRQATCDQIDSGLLTTGGIRQMAIVYKSPISGISCRAI